MDESRSPLSQEQLAQLKSYARKFDQARELAHEERVRMRSRYVWFVAICGYALLNGPKYWELLLGGKVSPQQLFLLSVPWAVTAALALLGYLITDALESSDKLLYTAKSAGLETIIISADHSSGVTTSQVVDIMEDKHPSIAQRHSRVERLAAIATWVERLAVFTLFVAFLWAVFGARWIPWIVSEAKS